ncbi:MAG: phenylalanine--tRNA ligase subunit beta, partial [Nitrosopumilaceae archaeon]|nr:phenylalanine--tRNA ligase subunit beta [Nitrosopumilaceae archaeon]
LQGLLGIKTGSIKLKIKKSNDYGINVKQNVSRIRPYVTGIIAKNGRLDDKTIKQLMTMQEDMHFGLGRKRKKSSIGIHDLDKISFPLIYSTTDRETKFIPLNSDKELSISQILESTDVGKNYGHLVNNSPQTPIILDSSGTVVSFPPIVNAAITTLTPKTKNIFVEVTGLNKDDVEDVLSVIATTLQFAGFSLVSTKISGGKNSTPKLENRKLEISIKTINQILGLNLSPSKIVSCLKKSRIDATIKGKNISCSIPPYRFDIFGGMDIVEEVALGYGIQNLEPVLSPSKILGNKNSRSEKLKALSLTMVGLGYTEALNSSLTSTQILYGLTNRDSQKIISVLDSKSQEHTILRDMILPGLIENLSRNIHEPYPQKLFETGTVFFHNNPIDEKISFACVSAHKDSNFSEMKSILQSVLKTTFNLDLETKTSSDPIFEKGRTASVIVNDKTIGLIGEINSKTINAYKIRVPVVGFEIQLSGLIFD